MTFSPEWTINCLIGPSECSIHRDNWSFSSISFNPCLFVLVLIHGFSQSDLESFINPPKILYVWWNLQIKEMGFSHLDKLSLPKLKRGLILKYPDVPGSFCGAKTWWYWMKSNNTLWALLWCKKYYPLIEPQDLIILSGNFSSSLIWNNVWKKKDIIHTHFFGEVKDETWPQLPPFQHNMEILSNKRE